MFHTYIDYTNDGRPFYVGMGDDARLHRLLGRNKRHTHTAKKHGQNRKIVATFEERENAIDLEIKLIAEHHTFVDDPSYNGFGCNYTPGGEGRPCSEEMKQKMREIIKAQYASGQRQPWNKGKQVTYNITEEDRQARRAKIIAFNKSLPMLGKKHTDEALTKMRKPHRCSNCGVTGHQKRTCKVSN